MIFSYYHITTEQLQAIDDNLGHDHFMPIEYDGGWIVSVSDWYGDVPDNWQCLDLDVYKNYCNELYGQHN